MVMILRNIIAAAVLSMASIPAVCADGVLGIDGEESTSVGIYIKDLESGEVVLDHNSQLALTPASVMKCITAATALSVNGASGRFVTPVALRGAKGAAGQWNGDLVVSGCADPTLESENFKSGLGFCDSIVVALRKKGIKKITGAIVVRQSLKDAGPVLQWEIEDVAWPYGAGLYGFNWRDNIAKVYPNTGKTKPEVPGMKVTVTKVDGGNDLVRGVGSDHLMAYTPNTRNLKWVLNTTVPDPAAVFVAELTAKLDEAGITVGKKATAPSGEMTVIYRHRSQDYGDIMHSLMVRSDNLFAEGMLRSIEPGGSRKAAIKREKELWATRGINTRYTIINDGSGLTRANRLSAHFIGDVLEWMAKSPHGDVYTSFFPRAGKEGTLRGFLSKTPLAGKIALKTGSVSTVQCYAGYKFNDDGKATHIIVILVNGFFCPRKEVREAAETLLLDNFAPAE